MQYKYAREHRDYSDFASGRVLHSLPGHPAFPVRLASEIFQRCLAHRQRLYDTSAPCTLYDPCCGAAYQLSVVVLLHGEHIREILASDVDEEAVTLAARNLQILTPNGLSQRIAKIEGMLARYGKDSHRAALHSAAVLQQRLGQHHRIATQVFRADATQATEITDHIQPGSIDVVFTDVPYGLHSHWATPDPDPAFDSLSALLESIRGTLSPASVVAIASDKQQKVRHEQYQRLEHFQVGKRRVVILRPHPPR